jgi:hypothetical protein
VHVLLALLAIVASPPNVTKLALAPAQVGSGYVLRPRPDGVGVNTNVTLDLCGRSGYPSEKLRVARLQLDYLKPGAKIGLSNEIVAYKHGGAAQAMREVIHHARTCPRTPINPGPGLPPLRFTMTLLKGPKLLKGYLFVRVRVQGKVQGKEVDQISYAVYQRRGDVLSGTYSFGAPTKAQETFALHAAQQSALNLLRGKSLGGATA